MPLQSRLSLRQRLASIAIVAFLGFAVMTAVVVNDVRETALESHRTRIQHIVDTALGVTAHFKGLADAGTLTQEQAQEQAKAALRPLRFGADDYFFIYDFDGRRVMLGSDATQEGQITLGKTDTNGFKLFDRIVELGRNPGQGFLEYAFPRAAGGASEPKLAFVKTLPGWNWIVGTGVYIDDVDAIVQREAIHNILMSLAAIAVVVFFIFLISRSVLNQLGGEPSQVMDIMQRAKDGELNLQIDSAAPEGSVLGSLRGMLQGLSALVRDIHRASTVLAGSAGEVAETSRQVSEAAQMQADATSSMAAGVEEMTVAINHIADNAKATEKVSLQATELAAEGGKRAHSAVEAINSIATTVGQAGEQVGSLVRRTNEIGSIAAVIKEIAAQTNLLALNAAIEAARAGDQGRGFAVVADEVRGLAERTSSATVQIEQMILGIQQDTRQAVDVMETAVPQAQQGVAYAEAASTSLSEMLSGARVTLDHVREVANATHEQGIASNSIAQQVEKIAQMVEETSQAVAHSADTAHSLTVLSETLNAALRRFKV